MKENNNKWLEFYNEYKFAIFGLVAVTLACYLFQMTNFTFSIDEQSLYDSSVYISFSRYGTVPLKMLFGSIPIFGTYLDILSVLLLFTFTILMAQEYFKISSYKHTPFFMFLFMAITISFPFNANYIIFSTYCFEVSTGLCFVALAVKLTNLFLKDKSLLHCFGAVFFLWFAVAIYQSFLSVYMVGACFSLYFIFIQKSQTKNTKPFFIALVKYCAIFIVSYVLYILGDVVVRFVSGISNSSYIDSFMAWGKKPFAEIAIPLFKSLINILRGKIYPDFVLYIMPLTAFLVIALLIYKLICQKKNIIITVICFLGFAIAPFLMSIIMGGIVPVRALQGVGLSIAGVWLLCGEVLSNKAFLRKAVAIAAIYLVMFSTKATANLFFSDYMVLEQEKAFLIKMTDRIDRLGFGRYPEYPVCFVGKYFTSKTPNMIDGENLGVYSGFFVHHNRVEIDFMRHFGYNYNYPSQEQTEKATELSKDMPVWPSEGCVALKDDVIIVKLS